VVVVVAKHKIPKTSGTAKSPPKTRGQKDAESQALAMWALLGAGGAAFGGQLKPEIEKAEREALLKSGLVTVEKRQRSYWLDVTDRGWHWAEQHLADPLPDKTFGGAFVLRAWLTRLQAFMQARDFRLAHVLSPQAKQAQPRTDVTEPLNHAELRMRIRAAYLDVTGGFNRRALLKDIRSRLPDIDRSTLDAALKRMQRVEDASLMQLDNRIEVTDADHEAALQIGTEPRHILWISK
jgi:hypothetical protein